MKKKKRSMTLIEIMIVILLIGLIGGALAFNMRGSLDEGRAFKTEQNMLRIQDILMMKIAEGTMTPEQIAQNWTAIIERSPLISKPDEVQKDGWGNKFEVTVTENEVTVKTEKYENYRKAQKV